MDQERDQEPGPCNCLLCQDPLNESAWDARDARIARSVRDHGWHVMGVHGEATADWAYSIGLWHSLRSPEVCLMGAPIETAMHFVNKIGAQIRDGRPLMPNELRDGVLSDRPVTFLPVHPSWYQALFGAGLDFIQAPPWPMVQAVCPDDDGLFPWDDGANPENHADEPMLWLGRAEHPTGPWSDESLGHWPFAPTMPYHRVLTTQAVLDGAPVGTITRDQQGIWHFTDADSAMTGNVEAPLMQLVKLQPDLIEAAGLQAGVSMRREGERWRPV